LRRYRGAQPDKHNPTNDAILNEMRCGNGSQCNTSRIYWGMWTVLVNPSMSRGATLRETREDGTAIVKVAKHNCMDE